MNDIKYNRKVLEQYTATESITKNVWVATNNGQLYVIKEIPNLDTKPPEYLWHTELAKHKDQYPTQFMCIAE